MKTDQIKKNQISTDDLAFSAYLKTKGYGLIRLDQNGSKKLFIFDIDREEADALKVEFINSAFLNFYNELRNLKKLV
jgi:hypothetical protein